MTKEVNAMPFTSRLNYSVKEVSLEEFMKVVRQRSQKKSEINHMSSIKEKINQYHA